MFDQPKSGRDPFARRAAIVPYLIGANQIWRRLKWDLKPEAWRSRRRLRALHDSCRGKRAVILCNGPSLNRVDLSLLQGIYCFGLNKIYLKFAHTDFRPSAIVVANPYVLEQSADFLGHSDLPLFLNGSALRRIGPAPNRIFLDMPPMEHRFARDCSVSVHMGSTVTYVALQLAYHMGFDKVALVGCDHHFEVTGRPHSLLHSGDIDPNHFDSSYFSNHSWQAPDLLESELSYRAALEIFSGSGRVLVNATDGGRLEILPRMALPDFLAL